MEYHISRGILRFRGIQAKIRLLKAYDMKLCNVGACYFPMNSKRLYHQESNQVKPRLRRIGLLSNPALCVSRPPPFQAFQTRTIIIGRVIDWFRNSDLASIEGISQSLLQSAPVSAVQNFYEWTEAATGLPWGITFLLCSTALQLTFNAPVALYMGWWMTGKEKHTGDMIAIRSSVVRAPSRENFLMLGRMNKELAEMYGCQTYKLYLSVLYQIVYVTITSFAVRGVVLNATSGAASSTLPWGCLLSSSDSTFILPILNIALTLLMVEVGAWKNLYSEDGLKMTMKRAAMPFNSSPFYILNVRRFCCLPFLLIYCAVPSALALHWLAMVSVSLNVQILLAHSQTRRKLGIAPCYFETNRPYQDFFKYLKNDYSLFQKRRV